MIPEKNPYNNWNGNGNTKTFDFDFYIEDETQLIVLHTNSKGIQSTLKYGTDYSINEFKNENGSFITFPLENSTYQTLGEDEVISLILTLPISQENEYGKSSYLDLKAIEYSLDYLTRICQIINRQMERSVKTQEGSSQSANDLIEALQDAQVNASAAAASAASSAQAASKSAIQAGEEATEATQKTAEIQEIYDEAMKNIEKEKTETLNDIETALAGAERDIAIGRDNIASDLAQAKKQMQTTQNTIIDNIKSVGIFMEGDRLFYYDKAGVKHEFRNDYGGIAPMAVKQRDIKKHEYIQDGITHKGFMLTWTDPDDSEYMENVYCNLAYTLIVRKLGSYPESPYDGDVVVKSEIRNQYAKDGYFDEIDNTKDYKYRAFPCSINKVYSYDDKNKFGVWLFGYTELTTESNPDKRITYIEDNEHYEKCEMDFVNDIHKQRDWENSPFMHWDWIRPCMLYNKNGNNIGLRIHGNLNNENKNGDFNGFTTAIYSDIDYVPDNAEEIETFELSAGFTTGETINTTQQTIYGNSTTNAHSPQLIINSTKKLEWSVPTSAYAYTGGVIATSGDIEPLTHYTTRIEYNKSENRLTAYMSVGSGIETKIGELSITSIGWNEVIRLGLDLLATPFNGTIHIKECAFIINEEKVFDGSKYKCLIGQVMEYLDPKDHSKTIDGKPSHVSDQLCGANAMVEKRKIFSKKIINGAFTTRLYSNEKGEGFECYPCLRDDGTYNEFYYTPMYDGSLVNEMLVSLSGGLTPISGRNAEQEINYARANGEGHDTEVYSDIEFEESVFKLLYKSTNSETSLGAGKSNGGNSVGACLVSGTMDKKGISWGSNSTAEGVKFRYRENFYGSQWQRMRGIIIDKGTTKVKMTKGLQDGSTVADYNITGEGYISLDDVPKPSGSSGGYASGMYSNKYGDFSTVVSGSSSTYLCDGRWFDNGIVSYPYRGGSSDIGALCGAFCFSSDLAASATYWDIGAALSYKPL